MDSITYSVFNFLKEFFVNPYVLTVLGAAIAIIVPGMGSAKAVGKAGEALDGLLSEDPSKFGKAFLLQALPATQGIYGFLIAFILLRKLPNLGDAGTTVGLYFLGAALPIAVVGYISAICQGKAACAGIATIAKQPEASGKCAIATAMVELYALLSLLISFLLIQQNPFGIAG